MYFNYLNNVFNYSNRIETKYDEAMSKGDDRYMVSPKSLLVDAVNANTEVGSCTCVIVTMDPSAPVVQSVNLGDSGYMIVRKTGEGSVDIVYESKE